MTMETYGRWTNAFAAIAVLAALSYDHAGALQMPILVVAVLSAAGSALTYFRFSWFKRRAEDSEPARCSDEQDTDTVSHEVMSASQMAVIEEPLVIHSHHASVAKAGSYRLLLDPSLPFAPRQFDPREIGVLLAELEKNNWDCSVRAQPPTKDFALNIYIQNGTVRFVPSVSGGIVQGRQKQPLSKPGPLGPSSPLRLVGRRA